MINNKQFKEFNGQFVVGEMNQERLVRIMLEEINGTIQGAVTPFLENHVLRKGNNRLAFAAVGTLWVGQTDHGWLGDRVIQRVSLNGAIPFDIQNVELKKMALNCPLLDLCIKRIKKPCLKLYQFENTTIIITLSMAPSRSI